MRGADEIISENKWKNDAFFRLKKTNKKIKISVDKAVRLWYNHLRRRKSDIRWCGSMAEQLICNQQVVGSTPITSLCESFGSHIWGISRAAKGGRL